MSVQHLISGGLAPSAVRVFCLVAALSASACKASQGDSAGPRALLVGCTKYDLDDELSLEGPINDVALMQDMLVQRFDFAPENIRRLTEGLGPENRPTKANIVREMENLIEHAQKGQKIVLFFAGHGCQQPDQTPPDPKNDPEPDGLDEVFLPADFGRWDEASESLANVIVDDQFRKWTGQLLERGAELFVVIDSCHSGSALRDVSADRLRRVDPEKLIPKDVLAKTAQQVERTRGADTGPAENGFDPLETGRWVALYAAQPGEPTVESRLPKGSPEARPQGLFSFALCQVLQEGDMPSYRELIQRIRAVYLAQARQSPTPMVEGKDLDRLVLGAEQKPPSFQLERDGSGLYVRAGQLHGLTKGSILAVRRPQASEKDPPAGHVQVVDSGLAQSRVEPCAYQEQPRNEDLPPRGLCRPVFIDYGDMRLHVAVDAETTSGADLNSLLSALQSLADRDDAPLSIVKDAGQADWLVSRYPAGEKGQSVLVPRSVIEKERGLDDEAAPQESRLVLSESDPEKLDRTLRALNKASNLLALAGRLGGEADAGGLDVRLELKHYPKDANAQPEVLPLERLPTLPAGGKLQFRVTNNGRLPVDFTLLFVDSAFGITSIFPKSFAADNRLKAGGSWQSDAFPVTADTIGREHAVLIAVESGDTPISFAFLAQASLEAAHRVFERGGARKPSPSEEFLQSAAFGGPTRGLAIDDSVEPVMQTRSWVVKP